MHRHLRQHVGEVLGRAEDGVHVGDAARLDVVVVGLEVRTGGAVVELGQLRPLVLIGDDDPAPVLHVAAGRRLAGDADALLDHVEVDRRRQVEALAHRPRRREQLVGLGEVERRVGHRHLLHNTAICTST